MDALLGESIRTEATASELMNIAADPSGLLDAEALRAAARRQRVRALELRGQLAALRERDAARCHPQP